MPSRDESVELLILVAVATNGAIVCAFGIPTRAVVPMIINPKNMPKRWFLNSYVYCTDELKLLSTSY